MKFELPEIHKISVDFDGERFEGAWWVIGGGLIVGYIGYTDSTFEWGADANKIATTMLRKLVRKHYVKLEQIPMTIPEPIRLAAYRYVNASLEESVTEEFVASFGDSVPGSLVHERLSWLCVNAISMIVPAWKHLCDDNIAEQLYDDLRRWLADPTRAVDWPTATTPAVGRRNGVQVEDCDACRLEPTADAVASTARYLQIADAADAIAVLSSAGHAYNEGCHSRGAPDRFQKWIVFEVLESAVKCEPLP
jgi:hypothetical protein